MTNRDTRFRELFTREHSGSLLFTEIACMDFEERLGRYEFFLKDLYAGYLTTGNYDELSLSIRNAIENLTKLAALQINWEQEIEHERETLENQKLTKRKESLAKSKINRLSLALPIKQAKIYIELAYKSKREGKLGQAWSYACEAGFYCGRIEANSIIDLDFLTIEKTSKTNSSNGKAITKKYEPLQAFISNLILTHAPKNGWPSKTAAIRAVTSLKSPANESDKNTQPPTLVEVFIQEHKIPRITGESIYDRLLKTWMYECDSIKNALKETVLKPSKGE